MPIMGHEIMDFGRACSQLTVAEPSLPGKPQGGELRCAQASEEVKSGVLPGCFLSRGRTAPATLVASEAASWRTPGTLFRLATRTRIVCSARHGCA